MNMNHQHTGINAGITSATANINQKKSNQHFDSSSSILSDYDDLIDEVIDDSSSYVLFNPIKRKKENETTLQQPSQNDSDILSLTNTSNTNSNFRNQYHFVEDEEEEEEDYDEDDTDAELDDDDDVDASVKQLERTIEGQSKVPHENYSDLAEQEELDQPMSKILSNKINNWYNSSVTDQHNQVIDDNIASWNLDENLIQDTLSSNHTLTFTSSSSDSSQRQLSNLKPFYGDELLKYLSPQELEKFRNFNKLIDIKKFLLEKDSNSGTSIITQILNLLLLKNHTIITNKSNNQNGSETLDETKLTQYLQEMRNRNSISINNDLYVRPKTYSETTNSSLVLCGGVGFGSGSSWNDI
ncbi:uncharacterized protein RJT21DRAFT_115711 [Scheffersomyces amazonensis]|uniref:uncharacterized protein n=1 Tax=Scheffersomyces amazonensis TaxID=1078765 RepID=UPI00315DB8D0